jgi:uncharacterized membrane protein
MTKKTPSEDPPTTYNETYRRKEMCTEIHKGLGERCATNEKEIAASKKRLDSVDKKITASLIFALVTLVSVLIQLVLRA